MKKGILLLLLLVSAGLAKEEKKESENEFRGWSEGEFVEITTLGTYTEEERRWIIKGFSVDSEKLLNRSTIQWAKIAKISKTHLKVKLFYEVWSVERDDYSAALEDPDKMKKITSNVGGRLINIEKDDILWILEWQKGGYPPFPSFWERFR